MISAVAAGCESATEWEAAISTVCASIRFAMWRWASGGIAWSCEATRYQDGSDFQAATEGASSKIAANGRWRTASTLTSSSERSPAKASLYFSGAIDHPTAV